MQVKSYNRAELQAFIDSDFYKNLKQLPISYHRAISHIQNPDVQEDDELLWAAYENEQLVGYVGVLPNYINVNHEHRRIYWLSCFWVDESFRNGNLASMLFFPLIKRYKDQLFISNFLPNMEEMYQRLNIFKPTLYKFGSQFYCRSFLNNVLPIRIPKTRFIKPLLRFLDFSANFVLDFRKLFYIPFHIHSKVVNDTNFDADFQDFITIFYKKNDYVERFSAHFNWILNFPWVLQGKPDKESKRYYFSSKSEQFFYDAVKFFRNNTFKAFLLLKIRDGKLTVSYVFAEDEMIDDITAYILMKISAENLSIITTFDERIANKIRQHRIRYLFERFYKRAYILPKNQNVTPDIFQEGDGDNIFT